MSDESTQIQLTDETVAKALGWESQTGVRVIPKGTWTYWWKPEDDREEDASWSLPKFTTSLDAIVGEIKRRKISRWCWKWISQGALDQWSAFDCCRSAIAYLEDHPNG